MLLKTKAAPQRQCPPIVGGFHKSYHFYNLPCKYLLLLLSLLVFVLLSASCTKSYYPRGSRIAVFLTQPYPNIAKPFDDFKIKVEELFITFSEEKGDFILVRTHSNNAPDTSAKITHVIHIRLDSILLTDYNAYLKYFTKMDKQLTKQIEFNETISKITEDPLLPSPAFLGALATLGKLQDKYALEHNRMRFSMLADVSILDLKTNKHLWHFHKKLDLNSYEPINEGAQLGQLFSVVESTIRDKAPFLRVE